MVRLAIRDAWVAKGLTQSHVADAMEWSRSKVMRIESGEVTIPQFARALVERFDDMLTPDEITARIETRTLRRRAIEQRTQRPDARSCWTSRCCCAPWDSPSCWDNNSSKCSA